MKTHLLHIQHNIIAFLGYFLIYMKILKIILAIALAALIVVSIVILIIGIGWWFVLLMFEPVFAIIILTMVIIVCSLVACFFPNILK